MACSYKKIWSVVTDEYSEISRLFLLDSITLVCLTQPTANMLSRKYSKEYLSAQGQALACPWSVVG